MEAAAAALARDEGKGRENVSPQASQASQAFETLTQPLSSSSSSTTTTTTTIDPQQQQQQGRKRRGTSKKTFLPSAHTNNSSSSHTNNEEQEEQEEQDDEQESPDDDDDESPDESSLPAKKRLRSTRPAQAYSIHNDDVRAVFKPLILSCVNVLCMTYSTCVNVYDVLCCYALTYLTHVLTRRMMCV